jgi:hypothetical protein
VLNKSGQGISRLTENDGKSQASFSLVEVLSYIDCEFH